MSDVQLPPEPGEVGCDDHGIEGPAELLPENDIEMGIEEAAQPEEEDD